MTLFQATTICKNMVSFNSCLSILLLLALALTSTNSLADIYKTTLPDGSVEYTDMPDEDVAEITEKIEESSIPSLGFPEKKQKHPNPTQSSPKDSQRAQKEIAYKELTITYPREGDTYQNIGGQLTVQLSIKPWLKPGDKFIVRLDGSVATSPSSSSSITVPDVYRGSHSISAEIVDKNGKVAIRSGSVGFFVHQNSSIKGRKE